MSTFETRLREGLTADDEAFLKNLEQDAGLFQQMGSTFSGPLGGWTIYAFIMSFAMFCVSLWAGWNMLQADSLKIVVLWGALFGWTSLAVGLIKIWFWMRMNHLAVLKQLKLIELRVVKSS